VIPLLMRGGPTQAPGASSASEPRRTPTRFSARSTGSQPPAGGVVRIPSGKYSILPIELKSDVTLDLAPTAVLLAWPRIADYPGYQKDATTGGRGKYSLISAHGCREVRIRAPFAEPFGSAKRLECTECDQIVDD
jgi:hypothetical protein